MISSVPNIGFDKLFLSGWQTQMRSAARDLRSAEASGAEENSVPEAAAAPAEPELSLDQQRQLSEMLATDRKVRAHEQAHLNVGRDLILSGPTYSYETGPDGKSYAVSGEVQIDTSPAHSPEETIPKAHHIRATALAPADPSPQDHRVASVATQLEINARIELALQESAAETEARVSPAVQAYEAVAADAREGGFRASA